MSELPERVVCAANKYGGFIVLGLRHNDEFMQDAVKALGIGQFDKNAIFHPNAQGFLTNRKRWVSRAEAYEIANNQEQIVRKTGGIDSKVLYSEDVY
jgi:hypothetical protein